MASVRDLERCARPCEREIAAPADQMTERESAVRLEVDHLRAGLQSSSKPGPPPCRNSRWVLAAVRN